MTVLERFKEKSRREPLVPIGCAATLACLGAGLYAFSKGNVSFFRPSPHCFNTLSSSSAVCAESETDASPCCRTGRDGHRLLRWLLRCLATAVYDRYATERNVEDRVRAHTEGEGRIRRIGGCERTRDLVEIIYKRAAAGEAVCM